MVDQYTLTQADQTGRTPFGTNIELFCVTASKATTHGQCKAAMLTLLHFLPHALARVL